MDHAEFFEHLENKAILQQLSKRMGFGEYQGTHAQNCRKAGYRRQRHVLLFFEIKGL